MVEKEKKKAKVNKGKRKATTSKDSMVPPTVMPEYEAQIPQLNINPKHVGSQLAFNYFYNGTQSSPIFTHSQPASTTANIPPRPPGFSVAPSSCPSAYCPPPITPPIELNQSLSSSLPAFTAPDIMSQAPRFCPTTSSSPLTISSPCVGVSTIPISINPIPLVSPIAPVATATITPQLSSVNNCAENSPPTSSDKITIYPRGYEFTNEERCTKTISSIIRGHYNGAYLSWKKVPQDQRNMMFRLRSMGMIQELLEPSYILTLGEKITNRKKAFTTKWTKAQSIFSTNTSEGIEPEAPNEYDVWIDAVGGKNKKGRIIGLAGESSLIKHRSSSVAPNNSNHWENKWEEQVKKTEDLQQEVVELKSQLASNGTLEQQVKKLKMQLASAKETASKVEHIEN
ncbi:hypothetical protein Tsubulata_033290 [Turnera subulata]|uniref:Uncharacterized protein n=1 Tax=Turnera subulata TaxID=218843 RepID=A0A9Q0FXV1_9ROSI|nr:hypothetical protein Tsubulata_033290 [Turnera subulata]